MEFNNKLEELFEILENKCPDCDEDDEFYISGPDEIESLDYIRTGRKIVVYQDEKYHISDLQNEHPVICFATSDEAYHFFEGYYGGAFVGFENEQNSASTIGMLIFLQECVKREAQNGFWKKIISNRQIKYK
jgi:hypothetical protein